MRAYSRDVIDIYARMDIGWALGVLNPLPTPLWRACFGGSLLDTADLADAVVLLEEAEAADAPAVVALRWSQRRRFARIVAAARAELLTRP